MSMDLTYIQRRYTTLRPPGVRAVRGPLDFIKLAIQDLNVPFMYFRRSLRLSAATGASFRVQQFDVQNPLSAGEIDAIGSEVKRGQWLVSKHISAAAPAELELITADDGASDAIRLAAISLELRIMSHQPIREHANIVDLIGFSWEKYADEF